MSKQEEARFNPFAARAHKSTKIKHAIAIASGKGGVGKSMVTGLLAASANQLGFKVGILDGDVTGPSIGKMFNITDKARATEEGMLPDISKEGIKIVSANMLLEQDDVAITWRGPMIANAVKEFYTNVLWGELDFLFVDMPPGTGDVPLTVYQSLPLDGVIMVTSPQSLVSMIVSKALTMARQMNVPILGLIENMSYMECDHCHGRVYPFGQSHLEEFSLQQNLPILAELAIQPELAKAADEGSIDEVYHPQIQKIISDLVFEYAKSQG